MAPSSREGARQVGGDLVPEPGGGLEVDLHGVDGPGGLHARRDLDARVERDLGAGAAGQGRLDLGAEEEAGQGLGRLGDAGRP